MYFYFIVFYSWLNKISFGLYVTFSLPTRLLLDIQTRFVSQYFD